MTGGMKPQVWDQDILLVVAPENNAAQVRNVILML